ncbi:hypothetical protein [Spirosoma areae]
MTMHPISQKFATAQAALHRVEFKNRPLSDIDFVDEQDEFMHLLEKKVTDSCESIELTEDKPYGDKIRLSFRVCLRLFAGYERGCSGPEPVWNTETETLHIDLNPKMSVDLALYTIASEVAGLAHNALS